jgi:hypothetical protein
MLGQPTLQHRADDVKEDTPRTTHLATGRDEPAVCSVHRCRAAHRLLIATVGADKGADKGTDTTSKPVGNQRNHCGSCISRRLTCRQRGCRELQPAHQHRIACIADRCCLAR